jgi:small nuclear ribonucleoprotein (snRNP)-like protein
MNKYLGQIAYIKTINNKEYTGSVCSFSDTGIVLLDAREKLRKTDVGYGRVSEGITIIPSSSIESLNFPHLGGV